MKHLYRNNDGELVAANSVKQAGRYHDCTLGGEPEPLPDWEQVPDDERITIGGVGPRGGRRRKRAGDWAAEYKRVEIVATTYTY